MSWLEFIHHSKHVHSELLKGQQEIMTTLKDIQDQVAQQRTIVESAVSLITGLKSALDAALASEDPAALKQLSDDLGSESNALAAAVAANTPGAPVV